MSADNWTDCHKCKKVYIESMEQAKIDLSKSYGKISEEDYHHKKERLKDGKYWPEDEDGDHDDVKDEYTLREDYEHWFDESGKFRMRYRASCSSCGFEYVFTQ